jgi:hypothetical protein
LSNTSALKPSLTRMGARRRPALGRLDLATGIAFDDTRLALAPASRIEEIAGATLVI